MKENQLHHGKRLAALLEKGWRFKADAARAFGVYPNTIQTWIRKPILRRSWFKRYSAILEDAGLNVAYITDLGAPPTKAEVLAQEYEKIMSMAEEIKATMKVLGM